MLCFFLILLVLVEAAAPAGMLVGLRPTGAVAPAFGVGGVGQESGEEGWALGRSFTCEDARDGLGNLLSLCGYGCGERGPALWGRWGQVKGLSLLPGLGDSPFLLIPTSQLRKLRPREGQSVICPRPHIHPIQGTARI